MNYIDAIRALGACPEAIEWLEEKNYRSLKTAWRYCHRGDWMLWLVARTDPDESTLQAIAVCALEIAELVEHLSPEARQCNDVNRRFQAGEASIEELQAAVAAAWVVAWSTLSADASAWAVWAAWAAEVATWAAEAAMGAVQAAWEAILAAAWAARAAYAIDEDKHIADIVRKHLPCPEGIDNHKRCRYSQKI